MPSPVTEARGLNIKQQEGSFLEDFTFQQATPSIHALRDPVCSRLTLVGPPPPDVQGRSTDA